MTLREGVLYKFEKDHCPICKVMEPLYQDFVSNNAEVETEKVDAVKEFDLSEKIGISSLPVFLYLKDEEYQMVSGLTEKKEFIRFTKKFLKTL